MAGLLLTRLFRADCKDIPPAESKRLLAENEDIVRSVTHRLRPNRAWYAAGLDMEDLYVIGRMAVLEAYLKYDPNSGASMRTWMAQVVRWRVHYAIAEAEKTRSVEDCTPVPVANVDETFEEVIVCRAQLARVAEVYGRLAPREQHILTQQLAEVPHHELAAALGISKRRSEKVLSSTREHLRDQLFDEVLGAGET